MVRHQLRHVAGHLLTPLLMCLGMALAYLGAFHQPAPHHLKVAVIGATPQTQVLAQTMKDRAGDALEVITLPSRDAALTQLRDRDLAGAYLPDGPRPELLVAKAGSDTTAMAAEAIFHQVAGRQGVPLTVTDIAPPSKGDPTAQGIFFLLVALSVGSYGSVAAIGAAGAELRMAVRAAVGVGAALAVSVIGIVVAGPVFHVIDHDFGAIWAMAWLYCAGIVLVGIGLHTYLRRWTTLVLMLLFVMLNFTSSGGIYRPELQGGFFGALHAFWNGAGFVEGARSLLYFDGGAGFTTRLLSLFLWLAVGIALVVLGGMRERRSVEPVTEQAAEEEIEEAVGV
ncbi:hypothetical protein D5S18_07425 [Nocardia panacis]|uniref:ABC transporter permease n=1 Tax=Nocardia panacis TaxID=2340916 RepID=A0A3A4KS38_9NOCA|nr:hypothetical protein [Nocardia panacis]RJO77570.1 hypothetical protein D5S18_07425 [Nocardia panacis]